MREYAQWRKHTKLDTQVIGMHDCLMTNLLKIKRANLIYPAITNPIEHKFSHPLSKKKRRIFVLLSKLSSQKNDSIISDEIHIKSIMQFQRITREATA